MKNYSRKSLVIILCLVAFVITGIIATTSSQTRNNNQVQQDEPTVVKKGQVTEKEREYSKEYKKQYSDHKARRLSEVVEFSKRKGNTQEIKVIIGEPDVVSIDDKPLPTESEFLRGLSCKADVIVLGSVKNKVAHLLDDETFVFTEYEFSVQDILKNNSASPIGINSNIQVTRPGGLIKLDDQVIRAEDLSYEPLQKNKEYLLFLRFVPLANGYVVSSPDGDFILENKSFKTLSKLISPKGLKNKDSVSFINDIRNSLLSGCPQTVTGGN